MLEIKTKDEWAFFCFFIGGLLLIINVILGLVLSLVNKQVYLILDGTGYFIFLQDNISVGSAFYKTLPVVIGSILNLVIGILALLAGLKLFTKPFYNLMTTMDVAAVSLFFIIFGIISFSISGMLILTTGGIFGFLYRLTVKGAKNPKAVRE